MKKIVHIFTDSISIPFLEELPDKLRNEGYELIIISADGKEGRLKQAAGSHLSAGPRLRNP